MIQTPKVDWLMNTFLVPAFDWFAAGLVLFLIIVVVVALVVGALKGVLILADMVRYWRLK